MRNIVGMDYLALYVLPPSYKQHFKKGVMNFSFIIQPGKSKKLFGIQYATVRKKVLEALKKFG